MKHCIVLALLILSNVAHVEAQPTFIIDSLDTYIEREMKRWDVPGLSIAIVKDGKILKEKGYGVSDIQSGEKVNEHTLFMVASNSKAFTGTALANLAFQKKLSLSEPVTNYLSYFSMNDDCVSKSVSIEDLLSHRVGFETFQSDFLNWGSKLNRKTLIENMKYSEPVYDFRSTYGYCNVCFLSAGEVIPAVCDTSWDEYISSNFFKPLGMHRSSTTHSKLLNSKNKATPYTLVHGNLTALPYVNIDNLGPAASINSSAHDMSQWLMMQLDTGRYNGIPVFNSEVILDTWKSRTVVRDRNGKDGRNFMTYGLGWFMYDLNGKRIINHDGGANGFVTSTCFIPSENLGIVVLTNTDANSLYYLLQKQIIYSFLGFPYENYSETAYKQYEKNTLHQEKELEKLYLQSETIKKWTIPMDRYTGEYSNQVYGKMTIQFNNNRLTADFENHPDLKAELQALPENKLLAKYNDPTYGTMVYDVVVTDEDVIESITVRVHGFIDFMPYLFKKL